MFRNVSRRTATHESNEGFQVSYAQQLLLGWAGCNFGKLNPKIESGDRSKKRGFTMQNSQYVLAEEMVDAIHGVLGFHPGFRALHAQGNLYRGTFTATPEAKKLSRAVHLQGNPVPVTVRFSIGGGDPDAPPKATVGMATKFYLPDGRVTDLVTLNAPSFFIRKPEELVPLAHALAPVPATGQPDPVLLQAFLATHPATAAALEVRHKMQSPVSFSKTGFFGIHAFRFLNAEGVARYAKYHWIPEDGVAGQTVAELQQHPNNHLFEEMARRVEQGPVKFVLKLELAEPGDPLDDATAIWPDGREMVTVGHLEVVAPTSLEEIGNPVMLHDPTRVTDGIELSDDPIVQVRRGVYEVSAAQRTGGWHSCPFAAIAGDAGAKL
jgi:catalase